ncbi:hypothetical protein BpHYR1_039430 [Brachionus plicatilis]|uniref:Uncharacterized protein n=1 Tax=Brachionus plicatilis TaxID=10195 RepID=A0A3M7T504_BRAPC|nr:hypothetical protein BpHYR1_039430 [Brachionus plicatilis]
MTRKTFYFTQTLFRPFYQIFREFKILAIFKILALTSNFFQLEICLVHFGIRLFQKNVTFIYFPMQRAHPGYYRFMPANVVDCCQTLHINFLSVLTAVAFARKKKIFSKLPIQ